ncbi:maltokinase N-terminal cap-like domain-containing protein [Actinomyces succiniciruminis]|uniref:Maltokinase n=1 Tax=Actinomyces succiniciruminis TaxID=1522002 RepID=A0A1L7RPL3_9ACTO|nr:1,4-alpha-glucan branching protein [Actinomyces succiniciruminis]CED91063.1 Maltokinase [Actinomyces succiniciruminis]
MSNPMVTGRAAPAWPDDAALLAALADWMGQRRWYPLKGEPAGGPLRIAGRWELADGVRDLLVAVPRGEGTPVLVHVPLVLEPAAALAGFSTAGEAAGNEGFVMPGPDGEPVALVEGAHHPRFWRAWANSALDAGTTLGDNGALAIAERAERLRVTTGEQSNTSVVMPAPGDAPAAGDADAATGDLIVKLFRVLAPGRNPDVEVSVALARDGWDRVRTPVAWTTLTWADADGAEHTADAGVACTFVPRADDGFELFCALAAADDAGPQRERALALARDLGDTTAQMHTHLASALGTTAPPSPTELAAALRARAHWAMDEVPELESRLPSLRARVEAVLAELAALDRLEPATRVHGDYHLGQVLHAVEEDRWYVLDFEGEPLRPLAERSRPDQPLRDVAGMLRSFDYAAEVGHATHPDWLGAVRGAFLDGYWSAAPTSAPAQAARPGRRETTLLNALELDKALYEAVYEARNRPDWVAIPLHGIKMILTT